MNSKVIIMSFGKMHGSKPKVDIFRNVLKLPNPHFVPGMKSLSGKESKVLDWVASRPQTRLLIQETVDMVKEVNLTALAKEGKDTLTVGFMCHGGFHRSVACAELLNLELKALGYETLVIHRDLGKR